MKRLLFLLLLAGCAGAPRQESPPAPEPREGAAAEARRPGGYYKDDGPDERVPENLASIPDAVPRVEPLSRFANRPYEALGKRYEPLAAVQPFHERGLASWYGRRYHGHKTTSGETYDMYAMTAAHPTLPIPSYARVTSVATRRSVVVRINDRGPFLRGRVIDLSYAAAYRLGIIANGSGEVEVDAIVPGEPENAAVQPVTTEPLKEHAITEQALTPAEPAPARGIFLQVGAFSSRDNAEKLRARLAAQDPGELVQLDNLWRVQIGPFRSEDEARGAAQRLEPTLGLKPLVVVR